MASCLLGSDTGVIFLYDSSQGWMVFFVITAFLLCAANILVILIGEVFIGLIAVILFIICLPCILIAAVVSGGGDSLDDLNGIDCNCNGIDCNFDGISCQYCEDNRAEMRRQRRNIAI